jgi:hypothetical protein
MNRSILWLGGWASGLACWRSELEALYPGFTHGFLDAHDVLAQPGLLARAAGGLPPDGVLAAWSLGSLLTQAAIAEGSLRPACRVVSISPIFDFCGDGGPWPPAALARMIRRLPKAREAVLAEFWALMRGNSPVTAAAESAWKAQSRAYPLDTLLQGLEALAEIRVGGGAAPSGSIFLSSRTDPVAPTPRGVDAGPAWVLYPTGHLPFLDYPATLAPLLAQAPARSPA